MDYLTKLINLKGIWLKSLVPFIPDKRLASPLANDWKDYDGCDEVLGMVAYFNCGI